MTVLDEVAQDLYDQLTARTFYVVDTEFCTDPQGEHHLISIAVIPVVGGRRTRSGEELYREMNPGVPIDPVSSAIHGYTDTDVADMKPFAAYANIITRRLSEDGAVFVCHNTIDAHVLKAEIARLAADSGQTPVLPDLPVLDTQRLVTAVSYPGVGKSTRVSLDKLCDLTGVPRTKKAHDAREDARATADALIELLKHAATKSVFWTPEDLLEAGQAGTLRQPSGPSHIRSSTVPRPPLPPEHIARHIHPLTDPVTATSPQAVAWLATAEECVALRCPYLRDEAKVAAPANASILIKPLVGMLPRFTDPGQAGTALGAVIELFTHATPGQPPIPQRSLLKWWGTLRPVIAGSTPCDLTSPTTSCPTCWEGGACPRHVTYLPIAEQATLGASTELDNSRVRALLAPTKKSPADTWRKHHPDVLAYAMWRAATHQTEQGHEEAAYSTVEHAVALGLHTQQPRLTELAATNLLEAGQADEALELVRGVLADRNTDPGYDDLADWLRYTEHTLYTQTLPPKKPATNPRRGRPAGHVNPRLYS